MNVNEEMKVVNEEMKVVNEEQNDDRQKESIGKITDKILDALDKESDSILKHQYSDDTSISKFELAKLDIDANIMHREQSIELLDFIIDRLNRINVNSEHIKGLKELNEKSRRILKKININGEKIKRELEDIIMELKEKDKGSDVDACNLGYFNEIGCDY